MTVFKIFPTTSLMIYLQGENTTQSRGSVQIWKGNIDVMETKIFDNRKTTQQSKGEN